jgi:nicotinate-nucleotide pyrophosphorylase (carboxylating)
VDSENSRKDFYQHTGPSAHLIEGVRRLLDLAVWEDNDTRGDITSAALVPDTARGRAAVTVREEGVVAGVVVADRVLAAVDASLVWEPKIEDGASVVPDDVIGIIAGPVRTMLTAERILLNMLGHLSGIATLTRAYVREIAGTGAHLYDTRKTTLGWRYLEKYAVRCGGGRNHRTGLFDAILIKDNHLAFIDEEGFSPAEAVRRAAAYAAGHCASSGELPLIEVEVDSLEQLKNVLAAEPDIVLLDNMTPETLREAVALRDAAGSAARLESSGGVNLKTIRAIALSGVDRISVGALTHSARSLDIGLDWV